MRWILALVLLSSPALAQQRPLCVEDGESLIAELQKNHGEDVIADALNQRENYVRWLVDPRDNSWSMVVSLPNGVACLVAHGDHFSPVMRPDPAS